MRRFSCGTGESLLGNDSCIEDESVVELASNEAAQLNSVAIAECET